MLLRLSRFFSICSLSPSIPHPLKQSLHHCSCPWVMCISALPAPFLYCNLHPHGNFVTTNLYFLIPSPLHPFPYTPLPSGNNQNTLCVYDSVCVLICLVCFLGSIIDRYFLFGILLFTVLIFFQVEFFLI